MVPRYFVLHFISDPQGAAMLTRSLLMKSRKRVAHDAMYTYARLVHDVTDTDCHAKWQRSGPSFGAFQTSIFLTISAIHRLNRWCERFFYFIFFLPSVLSIASVLLFRWGSIIKAALCT